MLLNDTPTVQATRPSHAWLVGTATTPCCDVDHISEASLSKGQDAASNSLIGSRLLSARSLPDLAPGGARAPFIREADDVRRVALDN